MKTSPHLQIVIAEDNSADVMLVRQALKEHGIDCMIHVVQDGEQALSFLEEADSELSDKRIDLLVLDLNLPKRDGEEVLKKLRSTRHFAETPVIVMTAMDADAPEMKRVTEIASVCFPKPSNLDEFLNLGAIVRGLLENHSVRIQPINPGRDVGGIA
jgi:DNA-binding response OmpR family regulator